MADTQRCPATLFRCCCTGLPGHDSGDEPTPHACTCGGSWVGEDGADGFKILSWPRFTADGGEISDTVFMMALAAGGPVPYTVPRGGITFPAGGEGV